jgi:hypothetical protein
MNAAKVWTSRWRVVFPFGRDVSRKTLAFAADAALTIWTGTLAFGHRPRSAVSGKRITLRLALRGAFDRVAALA